ncbi:MAG: UDP-N-acetyl-D-glucosamine dehydrogenase [Ardenticatenia bacterium]|nr:MAG: UDP-N-acetyl-D-glucosamine dehydrogenase [Ardenticatenia bacterium]
MTAVDDQPVLLRRIADRTAHISILGLGYVGLPLAVEFARSGLRVTGIDVDAEKVKTLNAGRSYILDIADKTVKELVRTGMLSATTDVATLREADVAIICVPTPLNKTRDPDISYILSATEQVVRYAHRDMLVVLESTTYPGTTEEILLPRFEAAGFAVGKDFFLAFSPERIDPANPTFGVRNTPKVVGGITPQCARVAVALYRCAVDHIVPVSSTRAAEMVKLLENTFRAVNIGLVNEFAIICDRLGLDVWEIIEAASTKPYGFTPFYPGPGLGGHCLPIDPLYLSWKLRALRYNTRFIELADRVNSEMPYYVVEKIAAALNARRQAVNGARILVLGVAYKRNVGDVRESPALEIINLLVERGADISYHDPYVPRLQYDGGTLDSVALDSQVLSNADCVVIVTDHSGIDWQLVVSYSRLVVDTRNALKGIPPGKAQVVKL